MQITGSRWAQLGMAQGPGAAAGAGAAAVLVDAGVGPVCMVAAGTAGAGVAAGREVQGPWAQGWATGARGRHRGRRGGSQSTASVWTTPLCISIYLGVGWCWPLAGEALELHVYGIEPFQGSPACLGQEAHH